MSVPQEALQKMLMEMQMQLQRTQAELTVCDSQINRNKTNVKVAELTISEIQDTDHVWEGVGKAFFKTPTAAHVSRLSEDKRTLETQTAAMEKKKQYYETTLEKTVDGMNKILGNAQSN